MALSFTIYLIVLVLNCFINAILSGGAKLSDLCRWVVSVLTRNFAPHFSLYPGAIMGNGRGRVGCNGGMEGTVGCNGESYWVSAI